VVFTSLKFGSHFFKKVYFSVDKSTELLSLAQICREEFVTAPQLIATKKHYSGLSAEEKETLRQDAASAAERWARSEYDPHLSLVYSDVYPLDEAVTRTVDSRLKDMFGPDYATRGLGWTNGRLSLVRCEGPVEEWQELGHRDI
jgi:2',3'-cyclic-nucleotide 3'-phosphodiesterase